MTTRDRVRLIAGGDVMLGRDVRETIVRRGTGFLFEDLQALWCDADVRFANLECVLPGPGRPVPSSPYGMWAPWDLATGLADVPFDVLSLANNHILDHGVEAALDTAEFCRTHGLTAIGFGASIAEARRCHVLERNGLRVAFLAYADAYGPHTRAPRPAYADTDNMIADVAAAGESSDVVVVSLHADLEFAHHPAPWRVQLCRRLVEAGATLVLGHHPHVPQGVERHGAGLIAYSLGNLVYDATTRAAMKQGSPYTARSFLLDVELAPKRVLDWSVHPFRIDGDHRPRVLAGAERQVFMYALERWSADLSMPGRLVEAWVDTCLRYVGGTLDVLRAAFAAGGAEAVIQSELPMLVHGPLRPFADGILQMIESLTADEAAAP